MPSKKSGKPARLGRPPVIIDPTVLRGLAAIRCTVDEAATVLGTAKRTLLRKLKNDVGLGEAWHHGNNDGRVALKRLQWRHAEMSNSAGVQMTIHLSKHMLGETEKSLMELSGPGGGPIQTFDYSKLSDEQLQQLEPILAALAAAGGNAGGDQGGAASAPG